MVEFFEGWSREDKRELMMTIAWNGVLLWQPTICALVFFFG